MPDRARRFLDWVADERAAPADREDGAEAWVELAEDARAYGDRGHSRLDAAGHPPPDCGPGCPWCCYLPVDVTAPEALAAWRHARSRLGPSDLARVRERALAWPGPVPEPCPLLLDGRCSVHPARPLVCRAWNSTSSAACRRAHALGYESATIPVDVRLRAVHANAAEALSRGLAARGLRPTVRLRDALRRLAAHDDDDDAVADLLTHD